MGQRNLVTVQAVIGHEQPPCQALLKSGGAIGESGICIWFMNECTNLRNAFSTSELLAIASRNLSAGMREPSPAT